MTGTDGISDTTRSVRRLVIAIVVAAVALSIVPGDASNLYLIGTVVLGIALAEVVDYYVWRPTGTNRNTEREK